MIRKKQPEKVWTDKGTEFKGAFKKLCEKRGIATYKTQSETKSAFAERNIRSLKTIIYKNFQKIKKMFSELRIPRRIRGGAREKIKPKTNNLKKQL